MRHIAYQRQREEGRAQRLDALDEQRSRDIQRQFQGELQRKAVLDRRDDIGSQMEVEQDRKRGLDERGVPTTEEGLRRFREVEQRQQPPVQVPPEPPGLDRLMRNVFRQAGEVLAPGLRPQEREMFLPQPEGAAPPLPRTVGAGLTALRYPASTAPIARLRGVVLSFDRITSIACW